MLQPGGEPDLPLEPLGAERRGELRMEQLERDRAVVLEVLGQPDRGHAAAAELAVERVALPQPFAQRRDRIRHEPGSASLRNRGLFRSGSKVGSARSQAGER